MTESDVLRGALAAVLQVANGATNTPTLASTAGTARTGKVNLSVRLSHSAALRLDLNARATGLSRGTCLTRLIDGAPPVTAFADRKTAAAALSRSSAELAVLSRDLHHLTQLLRQGAVDAARQYEERLENADADVRSHLDHAAAVLAELAPTRIVVRRANTAASSRSTP